MVETTDINMSFQCFIGIFIYSIISGIHLKAATSMQTETVNFNKKYLNSFVEKITWTTCIKSSSKFFDSSIAKKKNCVPSTNITRIIGTEKNFGIVSSNGLHELIHGIELNELFYCLNKNIERYRKVAQFVYE